MTNSQLPVDVARRTPSHGSELGSIYLSHFEGCSPGEGYATDRPADSKGPKGLEQGQVSLPVEVLDERLRNALSKSIKTPREFSDMRSEYSELSNGETLLDSAEGDEQRTFDGRCKQITTDSHGRPVKPTKKGQKVVIATLKDGRKRERRPANSTSRFRGVTHHLRTKRWESHIWQNGKQIYLGGYTTEEQAALAFDIAAIKFRGAAAVTNFDISNYKEELESLGEVSAEELVLSLRRQSKGFSRGSSKFRGVTRHQKGKWEARIGQLDSKKYRYLGLYDTENDAAIAYDKEAVRQRGVNAVTNFDVGNYLQELAEYEEACKVRGLSTDGEKSDVHEPSASPRSSSHLTPHPITPITTRTSNNSSGVPKDVTQKSGGGGGGGGGASSNFNSSYPQNDLLSPSHSTPNASNSPFPGFAFPSHHGFANGTFGYNPSFPYPSYPTQYSHNAHHPSHLSHHHGPMPPTPYMYPSYNPINPLCSHPHSPYLSSYPYASAHHLSHHGNPHGPFSSFDPSPYSSSFSQHPDHRGVSSRYTPSTPELPAPTGAPNNSSVPFSDRSFVTDVNSNTQSTYRDAKPSEYALDVEELQNQDRRDMAAIDRNMTRHPKGKQQHQLNNRVKPADATSRGVAATTAPTASSNAGPKRRSSGTSTDSRPLGPNKRAKVVTPPPLLPSGSTFALPKRISLLSPSSQRKAQENIEPRKQEKLAKVNSQPLEDLETAAAAEEVNGPSIKQSEDNGSARKDPSVESVVEYSLFANGNPSSVPPGGSNGDFDLVLDFDDEFMTHVSSGAERGHPHNGAVNLAEGAMTLPLLDSMAKDEARRQQREGNNLASPDGGVSALFASGWDSARSLELTTADLGISPRLESEIDNALMGGSSEAAASPQALGEQFQRISSIVEGPENPPPNRVTSKRMEQDRTGGEEDSGGNSGDRGQNDFLNALLTP